MKTRLNAALEVSICFAAKRFVYLYCQSLFLAPLFGKNMIFLHEKLIIVRIIIKSTCCRYAFK